MGHHQTRKNTSQTRKNTYQTRKPPFKQEKHLSNKGKPPFKQQEKYFSSNGTPFKQGVSSDQVQKLTNGRSFRSMQGGCERWLVDIVYWYGVMRRKPRETGGGDGAE